MKYFHSHRLPRSLFLVSCSAFLFCFEDSTAAESGTDDPEEKAYHELADQVAALEQYGRVFGSISKLVGPTVVHIQSKHTASVFGQKFRVNETGSGVIVRLPDLDRPYVLTNAHVVEKAHPDRLIMTTLDKRILRAASIWADTKSDVAVVAIEQMDVPASRLGDSDKLFTGSWVLAIGSPFDLKGSLTLGIVSGKGRRDLNLPSGRGVLNQDFIQTDAAINPGNSGGPLVDLRGNVVGINTAIASQSGGSEGVGFAIPINLARYIAAELVKKGQVERAYLGVSFFDWPLDAVTAQKLALPYARGAEVGSVFPDSPAHRAGLQSRDVIIGFNGKKVEDSRHLTNMVSLNPAGTRVTLRLWRNRHPQELNVSLGSWEELEKKVEAATTRQHRRDRRSKSIQRLNLEIQELLDDDRERFGFSPDQTGVLIYSIRASRRRQAVQSLERFEVIEEVDGKPVRSIEEFSDAIGRFNTSEAIPLGVVHASNQGIIKRQVVLSP